MPQKTSPATGALIHTAACGGTAGNLQCRRKRFMGGLLLCHVAITLQYCRTSSAVLLHLYCSITALLLQRRCNTFAVLLQLPCSATAKGMRKVCSMERLIDKYLYDESPMGSNVR